MMPEYRVMMFCVSGLTMRGKLRCCLTMLAVMAVMAMMAPCQSSAVLGHQRSSRSPDPGLVSEMLGKIRFWKFSYKVDLKT